MLSEINNMLCVQNDSFLRLNVYWQVGSSQAKSISNFRFCRRNPSYECLYYQCRGVWQLYYLTNMLHCVMYCIMYVCTICINMQYGKRYGRVFLFSVTSFGCQDFRFSILFKDFQDMTCHVISGILCQFSFKSMFDYITTFICSKLGSDPL